MAPMPEQNPLPFPDDDAARRSGPAASPAAPTDETGAGGAAPATAALPVPLGAAVRGAKRPLWARLLGRLADPWLTLKIEPAEPGQYDDGRPVVYVLED